MADNGSEQVSWSERTAQRMVELCIAEGGEPKDFRDRTLTSVRQILDMRRRLSMHRRLQVMMEARRDEEARGDADPLEPGEVSITVTSIDELPENIIAAGDVNRVFAESFPDDFGAPQGGES